MRNKAISAPLTTAQCWSWKDEMADREITSETVWDQIESERVCMLTNSDKQSVMAKPMTPHCRRNEGSIWFVADRHSHFIDDKSIEESVGLIFQNSASNFFATIKGTTTVVDSREKVCELWNPLMREFFRRPSGPANHLFGVRAAGGELSGGSEPRRFRNKTCLSSNRSAIRQGQAR
jgi:general stress protein 26